MPALFRHFRFSPTITVTSLALALLCFWCSSWQWERYKAKIALIETYEADSTVPPVLVDPGTATGASLAALTNRRIRLSGTYDYSRQIIVTNRKHASGPGHWLLTPLKLDNSESYVVVSRGFIPFADREPETWEKYSFAPHETFDAVVKPSNVKSFLGPSNPKPTKEEPFPRIWFFPEIGELAKRYPYPLITEVFLQRVGGPPQGTYPAQSILVEVPPQTHYGYTIEWILLGIASLSLGAVIQAWPRRAKPPMTRDTLLHSLLWTLLSIFITAPLESAFAVENPEAVLPNAGIVEHLDTNVDLSLKLIDQHGNETTLRQLMLEKRPAIITPVYFECPRLCNYTLNALLKVLDQLDLVMGRDYSIVTYSFDSTETSQLAREKAAVHYQELQHPEDGERGWHFVTGSDENVRKLSGELGFNFQPDGKEYAHAAGFMVLTPEGKISRYFYGIEYRPKDVRLALVEASQGRIGTTFEKVFLFCFRYDHNQGKYTPLIWNITRIICIGFASILLLSLGAMKLREHYSK